MDNKEYLKKLLESFGPSGNEKEAQEVFISYCQESVNKLPDRDNVGNVWFKLGSDDAKTKILISAHIDQIALMVSYIDDSGFVYFISLGGMDRRIVPGSRVIIKNDRGDYIKGVINKAAVHVEEDEEYEKSMKIADMKVDLGVSSKEEAEKLVEVGDYIILENEANVNFGPNRIVGAALDDRSGVYVVSELLKRFVMDEKRLIEKNVQLIFASCTGEELGLVGAKVLAKEINPDISIDIDVTFATDDDRAKKVENGDIKLGEGPVISIGPDKRPELVKKAKEVAKHFDIKYQVEATRCGGTNTFAIMTNALNCNTMLISIPCRSMHTTNEVVDWRDLKGAEELISYLVWNIVNEG